MSDERPMCWMCADGAAKDGADIERLREERDTLSALLDNTRAETNRLRLENASLGALVAEMRDALETIDGGHIDRYPGAPDYMSLSREDFRSGMWEWSQKVARAVIAKANGVLR